MLLAIMFGNSKKVTWYMQAAYVNGGSYAMFNGANGIKSIFKIITIHRS